MKNVTKSILLFLFTSPKWVKEVYYLTRIKFFSDKNTAKVFLGFQEKKGSGGAVKLRDLKKYSSDDNRYSILYLVSSSLPFTFKRIIDKAKKSGAKIVWNQNGVGFPAWAGRKYTKINKDFLYGMSNADVVIFQSQFARQTVKELIFDRNLIMDRIVYNAVNTDVFFPASHVNERVEILVAGSHNNIQRVVIAIQTVLILKQSGINFKLTIAGKIKSNYFSIVKAVINENQLQDDVILTGTYNRSEAPEIFSTKDILLHIQPYDNCPSVVIEAMSSGLVVVAPKNGGIPEILGPELSSQLVQNSSTYHQYDWGRPEDYAAKIISLLPQLSVLKVNARERAVKLFDVKRWLSAHEEIFSA